MAASNMNEAGTVAIADWILASNMCGVFANMPFALLGQYQRQTRSITTTSPTKRTTHDPLDSETNHPGARAERLPRRHPEVTAQLPELRTLRVGLCYLFVQHTYASVALNERAEPEVRAAAL